MPEEWFADTERRIERMKALALARSSESASPETMSLTATFDRHGANTKKTCPRNECDGSGVVYTYYDDGSHTVKRCRCVLDEIRLNSVRAANIPAEFKDITVGGFDTEIYKTEKGRNEARGIKKIAIEYVKNFEEMKELGKGLYFYSEANGSGKTRLAVGVGNAIMKLYGIPVRFVTTVNLLNEIRDSWNDGAGLTETELIRAMKRIDALLLDDIGTERPTAWVNETFYNILNERMTAGKVTLFTSNCRIEELKHDNRIVSRIKGKTIPVKFPDESVRAEIARRENEAVVKWLLEVERR